MQGLFTKLDVPWWDEPQKDGQILIYAGSTGAGLFAIQYAKKAGYKVVTTCSPHSFDLVKSYGADAAYDYHTYNASVKEIKKNFPKIMRAFDGISEGTSTKFCAEVMAGPGGKIVRLLPNIGALSNKVNGAETIVTMAYSLNGKPYQVLAPLGPKMPAVPEDRAALVRYCRLLPTYLETDVFKAPPIQIVEGGFDGLTEGLDMLRKGKVSGKKLVLNLAK
jgi:NADPH:quinone reductase-like Zn-dependent oxidoreductase